MSDVVAPFPEQCHRCGTPLVERVRYPTRTVDDRGPLLIYTFCSEDCAATWTDERGE